MDRFLLIIPVLVIAAAAASHAALPPQVYWHKVLPNTPMPNAIKDLLTPDKNSNTNRKLVAEATIPFMQKDHGAKAATDTKPHGYGTLLEEELHADTKMNKQFTRTTASSTFLPRQSANSIPFSSSNLPDIFTHFSIDPNSIKAESMRNTLLECEEPTNDGEVSKYCATSLESMIDYVTSTLRTSDVNAISTTMETKDGATKRQQYTIASSGVKRLSGSDFVACHVRDYAYVVYYCHKTAGVRAYKVPMVGKDGTKVEAVAACHTIKAGVKYDSYLRDLHVKAGDIVNICHILPQDHLVWSPKN